MLVSEATTKLRNMVACPVCTRQVREDTINAHLDACFELQAARLQPRKSRREQKSPREPRSAVGDMRGRGVYVRCPAALLRYFCLPRACDGADASHFAHILLMHVELQSS